ncbi:pentapeptide repeat-containing protein [Actinocorallia sp. B10E7]|uniref:pentapeptide repeat-containing protein n=1 Tax=Actinocorallia sp. B10E7 TaxID=3153558 RepID=UPI00325CF575
MCGAATVMDGRCLAHLTPAARASLLNGSDRLNARGVTFSGELLAELLDATGPQSRENLLYAADFRGAEFCADADFSCVNIAKADFSGASFTGKADFHGNTSTTGLFAGTRFADADFNDTTFPDEARFVDVAFTGDASFRRARFLGRARFNGKSFEGGADFHQAVFKNLADFKGRTFTKGAEAESGERPSLALRHGKSQPLPEPHSRRSVRRGGDLPPAGHRDARESSEDETAGNTDGHVGIDVLGSVRRSGERQPLDSGGALEERGKRGRPSPFDLPAGS